MNEESKKPEIKTPLSVILDMAKSELENNVISCMQSNNIPAGLMLYVLESILSDIRQMNINQMSDEFVKLQESVRKGNEDGNSDSRRSV